MKFAQRFLQILDASGVDFGPHGGLNFEPLAALGVQNHPKIPSATTPDPPAGRWERPTFSFEWFRRPGAGCFGFRAGAANMCAMFSPPTVISCCANLQGHGQQHKNTQEVTSTAGKLDNTA